MGDIGTHAHNLVRFISGLEVTEVCAERGAIVPVLFFVWKMEQEEASGLPRQQQVLKTV